MARRADRPGPRRLAARAPSAAAALRTRVPGRPRGAFGRPDLERRLPDPLGVAAGSPAPVVVVTGAAGAGKTTLLSGLSQARPDDCVAWVTVVPADGAAALWQAVLAALAGSGAHPRPDELDRLAVPDPPDSGFVAEVAACLDACDRPLWLVVDQVENLTDPVALRSLELLLSWAGAPVRVVLAGRSEPAVGLHRLRVSGRLTEIRGADLAFSPAESARVLAQHGVELDPATLDTLVRHTQGWPAAVRLAALSLEDVTDPRPRVAEFAGGHRAVADFLVGEILDRLPADVLDFLLRTCIDDGVCVDLARALTGREDAGAVLEDLVRRNALTVELDRAGGWYHYHPLLTGYLRAALDRDLPARRCALHRTAARWYVTAGEPLRAMAHAAAGGDPGQVSELFEAHGLAAVLAGHGAEILGLVAPLSPRLRREPWTGTVAAAAALGAGAPDDAARLLDATADRALAGPVAVLHRALRSALDRTAAGRAVPDGRPAAGPDDGTGPIATGHRDVDLVATLERGVTRLRRGDLAAARRDLDAARERAATTGRDRTVLSCLGARAALHLVGGDLPAAVDAAAAAIAYAADRGLSRSGVAVSARVVRAFAAHLRLDEATAGDPAPAEPPVTPSRDTRLLAAVLELTARFDSGQDRRKTAVEAARLWTDDDLARVPPALVALGAPGAHRMCLVTGETDCAGEIVGAVRRRLGDRGEVALMEAAALVARGRAVEARAVLAPVLSGRTGCVVPGSAVSAWLAEAAIADRCGEPDRAHRAVAEAVRLAAPGGMARPFAERGDPVPALLDDGIGRFGHDDAFAQVLRERLRRDRGPVPGLLTDRERQVLAELPSMRTAAEIAEALFVSTNTVKTHMRSIYRKLAVPHRRAAVVAARRLGLL